MGNLEDIVGKGKDFACALYKAQPGALIPNPISDLLHFVWDDICDYPDSPGLPVAPSSPFTGGQCICSSYRVIYRLVTQFDGEPDSRLTGVSLRGAILGSRIINNSPDCRVEWLCRGTPNQPCYSSPSWVSSFNSPAVPGFSIVSVAVEQIILESGGTDNCGNPPIAFPTVAPAPPGGFTSPPIQVTFNDGGTTNIYFNLKPPVVPSLPAVSLPPVIVNILKPELNPEFNIPITFNIDGSVNFGGGGEGGGFNNDDRDTINNINTNINNVGGVTNNIQNDIENIFNNYRNAPIDPSDYLPPVDNLPPGKKDKAYLAAVEIRLTTIPVNAKTQSGETADDVVYAGWFEWRRAGHNLPREPIHFEKNVFLAPQGIDGYAWTLYTGYEGLAKEIINKPKES